MSIMLYGFQWIEYMIGAYNALLLLALKEARWVDVNAVRGNPLSY